MGDKIHIDDLEPGDVLLYRGKGFVSRGIQFFDGSPLSHAALYLGGGQIGEAIAEGLVARDYQTSFHGSEWIKAYRLRNRPADVQPVLNVARTYLAQRNRYGYEQLVLLALLCTTRKVQMTPILRRLLRTLLDAATVRLADLLRAGKEPMICSEFVYRAYDEADSAVVDAYSIRIPGMLPLPQEARAAAAGKGVEGKARGVHQESLAALFAAPASVAWVESPVPEHEPLGAPAKADTAALDRLIATYLRQAKKGPSASVRRRREQVTLGQLRESTDRFVTNLYRARPQASGAQDAAVAAGETAERTAAYQYLFHAAPDYVTPADLYTTDSLVLLGTVETA